MNYFSSLMAENMKGKNLMLGKHTTKVIYIISSCALSKNVLLHFCKKVLNLIK